MPFWRLYYHLVLGTKNREPFIDGELEQQLFPYLVAKAVEMESHVLAINGWVDHVHIVISIPPKYSISELVKRLKGASSHDFEGLWWQRGYGALSIGQRQLSVAVAYVENQKVHHAQKTTIVWLEREEDEDKADDGSIHEERGVYEADIPF